MKNQTQFFIIFLLSIFCSQIPAFAHEKMCQGLELETSQVKSIAAYPRQIDPAQTFDSLVQWVHDEIIVKRKAPGLVVGISGTDSVVAFLAAAKAFEKAGRPGRVAGVHFAPSEEFIDDHPAASEHLWFKNEVIPWLRRQAPNAKIVVDSSIDFRQDGLRWGALIDWSVIENTKTRAMRPPDEQFWVVGTRNATEEKLFSYSNISAIASVQFLNHLWKSEILEISKYLGAPRIAIDKSCEVDCVCGRLRLPANHIPEVDALLMVREGILDENYVLKNIPDELRGPLTFYINSQIESGKFKTQIPYKSDDSVVRSKNVLNLDLVAAVKESILEGKKDFKALSQLVPEIIAKEQPNIASDFVSASSPNREGWLPEALALFNTPGLRSSQKRQMLARVFSATLPKDLGQIEIDDLASLNARLGNYSFSFPQWRFLTQRYGDQAALAEQFGMQPLTRESDIRSPTLPPSDPARDELGRGFIWFDKERFVEFRRAYIVVSSRNESRPTTLIIRNSSHFFGRDRLQNAVYVSFDSHTPEEIAQLTAADLKNSDRFIRWQDLLNTKKEISLQEKIKRASRLLNYLDKFNANIANWLAGESPIAGAALAGPDHSAQKDKEGLNALLHFFEYKVANQAAAGKANLFLGVVEGDRPSWSLRSAVPVTSDLIQKIRKARDLNLVLSGAKGGRIVMMSGERGDFP